MDVWTGPFRSGNTAASLKLDQPHVRGHITLDFPQWKHCGLIEAPRLGKLADLGQALSAVETLRPH